MRIIRLWFVSALAIGFLHGEPTVVSLDDKDQHWAPSAMDLWVGNVLTTVDAYVPMPAPGKWYSLLDQETGVFRNEGDQDNDAHWRIQLEQIGMTQK